MTKIKQHWVSSASGAAVLLALSYAAPAVAQTAEAPPNQPAAANGTGAEEIVVTGSRIRRTEFDATVPITAVTGEELLTSGFTDLSESLADLPGVTLGDTNIGQPNGTIQNAGTTTVDLRNLGSNRTLTLIDGRRTVSNAANRNVVSLNTIPIDFIERVDIITGAASAIYGSDAIAGVVNIITENNLDGLRLKSRYGLTTEGGGEEYNVSATFGKPFADDRGYFLLSASYEDDRGLFARDRAPRATRSSTFNPSTNTVTEPDLSTDILGGRFLSTRFFFDETGLRTGFVTARDGYNDRTEDTLRVPRDVFAIAGKLRFEVAEALQPFVTVMFSDLDTTYSRAPIGVRNDTEVTVRDPVTGLPAVGFPRFVTGRIPRTNPFVPAVIRAAAPSTGIDFRRRFDELGNRVTFNDRDTLRVAAGVNGKFAGDWFYELSYNYGDFRQNQLRTGGVNLLDLQRALDAEIDPATGQARCRDATARAAGCVPINLFGVGSISPEAADYIRTDSTFSSHIQQHVVQGYVTGSLLKLPAGDLSVAAGFEYRADSSSLTTDDEVRTGFTTNSGVPGFDEKVTVKEAFVETTIPILKDQPFADDLSLEFAGRVADYSQRNVGTVFSYRAGLNYAPVEGLRFRAQYGTAQRAPDLAELFSPPRDDTDTTIDPCSGITAASTGAIAVNCRREPGVAAEIAATGRFQQDTLTINSPNAGNLDLKEEMARTLTAGAVFSPRALPGLDLSFDYYRIKVKDAIEAFSPEIILRQCYSDTNFPNNDFCPLITRSATSGELQQIVQAQENLNSILVSGFDVHLGYRFGLDALVGLPGRITLRADWNHVLKDQTVFTGINGPETDFDRNEIASPKDSVRAEISYGYKGFDIKWRTRYLGPAVASNERVADARELGFENPLFLNYGDYFRHDLAISMRPEISGRPFRLYGGINNIFDNAGPEVPEGATPDATNGYIPTYGIVGRSVYVGVELRF